MSKQLAEADEQYFRDAVALIEAHTDWSVDGGFGVSIDEAVDQAAADSGTAGELQFKHAETDGRLYVRIPDLGSPPGAMEALLEQPLDPLLDQVDSGIVEDLGEAHQLIAEHHATRYIAGEADPYTVLVVSVPIDYSEQELCETVERVSTVSTDVAKLHEDILESIDTTQNHG